MKKRIKKIFREAKDDPDLIIIMNGVGPHIDVNFFYVTGLTSGIFENCAAFLYPDGAVEILTSRLEEETAKSSRAKITVFEKKEERNEILKKRLKNAKRVGINSMELTHSNFNALKCLAKKPRFVDLSEAIMNARVVKEEKEIKNIKRAAVIASEAFEDIVDLMEIGIKEYELASEISYKMGKKGSSGLAFGTIVAFGENTAEPHYSSGNRALKKGDFIVMDFGAKFDMYCSDITRTLVMGKATKKQKEIYKTVLGANELAIGKVKDGVNGKALHNATKAYIEKRGFKGRFTHGLGHSLGLLAHDGKGLNPSTDLKLKRNMVFTIEPGVYIPGYGGARIEDDVVVRKGECTVLTKARKELIEL